MSLKVSQSEVQRTYATVAYCGYCDLQKSLRYLSPVAHTEGIYGWNADVYSLPDLYDNFVIVSGYRPFGEWRIPVETIKELENHFSDAYCEDAETRRANLEYVFMTIHQAWLAEMKKKREAKEKEGK